MKRGFTLIELIIVIVLFSMLAAATFWTFVVGLRAWGSGRDRAYIRQDANLAIERMVRELSQAKSFTIAQADQVKFDADIDNDDTDETVTFAISDSSLERTVDGTTTVLTPDLQTLEFSYRDLNDVAMALPITGNDRDNIRVIVMSLTLNEGDETFVLSSSAYARNQGL